MEAIKDVNGGEIGLESDGIADQVATGANETVSGTRKDKLAHDAREQDEQCTTEISFTVRRDLPQVVSEGTKNAATEDIEDWSLCETPRNAQENSKHGRAEKLRPTARRMTRSDTMKQHIGKSTFGGKTMVFNISTENDKPQRAQRAKKWQVPTKLNGIRNATVAVDSASERADIRKKRNLSDDNIDIKGLLIPNRHSVSAGTAEMMTKPVKPKETLQGIHQQRRDMQADTRMEKESHTEGQKPGVGGTPTKLRIVERAATMFKHRLTCPHCEEVDTLVKNDNTRYNGKVIKCTTCGKQLSGNTIIELFVNQIGTDWEHKSRRDLGWGARTQNVQAIENNHTEMNNESHYRMEREQERAHTPLTLMNNQHSTGQQHNSTKTNKTRQGDGISHTEAIETDNAREEQISITRSD